MPAISRFPTPDQTRLPHAARAVLARRATRLRVLLGDPRQAARIARDFRRAGLDARTLAMLEFAVKVTRRQIACSARDLQRLRRLGFSEEACWDIIETAAMFNFTNRLANAAGMRPNPEYRRMGRGARRVPSRTGLGPRG